MRQILVIIGRDVFQRLLTTVICHFTHKPAVGEAYMQEIREVLKSALLDTRVTPVGTPSSSSASDSTYIQICVPRTFEYIERP